MDLDGFEPSTLPAGRAPECANNFGNLVDLDGFEPSTSSMPWKRAPNCATGPLTEQFTTPAALNTKKKSVI